MSELIRSAEPREMKEVVRIVNSIFRPDSRGVPMDESFSHFLCKENADQIYVLERDGRIVSILGTLRSRIVIEGCDVPVVSVGAVCTQPEHRGQGLATEMLKWLDARLQAEGIPLMLVSGNLGLYLRQNCLEVGESYQVICGDAFGRDSHLKLHEAGSVSELTDERIEDLMRLYREEPVRFKRSEKMFKSLLRNQTYLNFLRARPYIFVHESDDGIDAYIVLGVLREEGKAVAELTEFAGGDEEVKMLSQAVKDILELSSLTIDIPNYRRPLAELLVSHGCSLRTTTIPGTIKVVDFERLWNELEPYRAERVGDDGKRGMSVTKEADRFRLSLGDESISLDQRAVTNLIFYGPQLPFPSLLKGTLSRVFPLPFVYPNNLNYI